MPVYKIQRTPKGVKHRQETMTHYPAAVEAAATDTWHRVVGSAALAVRDVAAGMQEAEDHFFATLQPTPKAHRPLKERSEK